MNTKNFPLGVPVFLDSKNLDDYYWFCYATITCNNSRGLLPYRLYGKLVTPGGTLGGKPKGLQAKGIKLVRFYGAKVSVSCGFH